MVLKKTIPTVSNSNSQTTNVELRTSNSILCLENKARQWQFELTFCEVQELLRARKISLIVLKGPHLAWTLYERPEQRKFNDLDLLVHPRDFDEACRILLEKGYSLCKWDLRKLASCDYKYNWGFISPLGVAIELHRDLAGFGRFSIDIEALFENAISFRFGEVVALGLDTEDLLLHLCLHAGKSYFFTIELKHLKDIVLLLQKKKIEWERFLLYCKKSGSMISAYYSLTAARFQFCAEIPEEVFKKLAPGAIRRLFLDRWLDPSCFPVYRFPDHGIGKVRRRLILLLMDRVRDWFVFIPRFAWISLKDITLRNGGVRKKWIKRHRLGSWLEIVLLYRNTEIPDEKKRPE